MFVLPLVSVHIVNFLLVGGVAATALVTCLLRVRYHRLEHEETTKSRREALRNASV